MMYSAIMVMSMANRRSTVYMGRLRWAVLPSPETRLPKYSKGRGNIYKEQTKIQTTFSKSWQTYSFEHIIRIVGEGEQPRPFGHSQYDQSGQHLSQAQYLQRWEAEFQLITINFTKYQAFVCNVNLLIIGQDNLVDNHNGEGGEAKEDGRHQFGHVRIALQEFRELLGEWDCWWWGSIEEGGRWWCRCIAANSDTMFRGIFIGPWNWLVSW